MIPTLILRVLDHHSDLFIIIKFLPTRRHKGSQRPGGEGGGCHILSFKKLLHSFDMKIQSLRDVQY